MADEPEVVSPGWHFSKNDLEFIAHVGKWVLAAIALATIWIQSHNQHVERIAVQREGIVENNERLERVASEVKATQRPLFGIKE